MPNCGFTSPPRIAHHTFKQVKKVINGAFKSSLEENYAEWVEDKLMQIQGLLRVPLREETGTQVLEAFNAITEDTSRAACRAAYSPKGIQLSELEDLKYFANSDCDSRSDSDSVSRIVLHGVCSQERFPRGTFMGFSSFIACENMGVNLKFSCPKNVLVFACLCGWRLRCTHTLHARTCLPVGVGVVRKLRPCLSYNGRRERINSVLLCILHKGWGGIVAYHFSH